MSEIDTRRKSDRPKKQRKAKDILGKGFGGMDGGKCLESGTNSRGSADAQKICPGSNVRKQISERESKRVIMCGQCRSMDTAQITYAYWHWT